MDRERAMRAAIHSGEMEGAWVSVEFRADAEAYIAGEITLEELLEFYLGAAALAGLVKWRFWLRKARLAHADEG